MTEEQQTVRLADGRNIACTSPAEARMIWGEMSPDGYYRRAAAQLRPGDVALDIGANIGLSAIVFADTVPGVQVIAAEPAPVTFACLDRNMTDHVAHGVSLQVAVGAEPGVLPFTYYPHASANSGLYADQATDDAATRAFLHNSGLDDSAIGVITDGLHVGERIDVEVTTVSAILAGHAEDADVGLLKVDVERAELDVLLGIDDADWPRIRTVVAEVHDDDGRLAAVRELLERHGLEVTIRQDPSLHGTPLYEVYADRNSPN